MIVATGSVSPIAEELLGEIVVADERTFPELLPQIEVLVVRGGWHVGGETIDAAPRLRVIARTGVGFDEIDVAAATRRGIPVVITPGAGAPAVAEAALTLVVALAKRLPELDRLVREGRWSERDAYEVRDLEGLVLGILGFGRIGRRLAELVEPIGMRVLACDPYAEGADCDLETLFAVCDAVSIHAPLTEETRGIVDERLLAGAKPGLLLVNLARGALVSSLDDLLAALESGRLGGVGLDVFDPEPPDVDHPLFRNPRVLVSPHGLWRTPKAIERTFRDLSEGVLAALRGERPAAVANPELYDSK